MSPASGTPVDVPRLNPNEDQVLVVRVHVADGDRIAEGDLLLEIETTKATAEVNAPVAGIVTGLSVREGQFVDVGAAFCRLADAAAAPADPAPDAGAPAGPPRITRKARRRSRSRC